MKILNTLIVSIWVIGSLFLVALGWDLMGLTGIGLGIVISGIVKYYCLPSF